MDKLRPRIIVVRTCRLRVNMRIFFHTHFDSRRVAISEVMPFASWLMFEVPFSDCQMATWAVEVKSWASLIFARSNKLRCFG